MLTEYFSKLTQRQVVILSLLFNMTVVLRVFHLGTPFDLNFDEAHYVPAARILAGLAPHPGLAAWSGTPTIAKSPDINFSHPPLGKFLIGLGMLAAGDNPLGWRLVSCVFGILSIGLMFLNAKLIFDDFDFAALATFFLSVDFLHIVQSRIAMLDIFLLFFLQVVFLGTALIVFHPRQRTIGVVIAGIGVGLGLFTKVPAATAGLAAVFSVCFCIRSTWQSKLKLCSLISGVCALTYSVSFFYYYAHGYSLGEWLQFHIDVVRQVAGPLANHPYASHPGQWLLNSKPVWYYFKQIDDYRYGVIGLGNPVTWLLLIPAIATLWGAARSGEDLGHRLLLIWCFASYIPLIFMLWSRQGYLYHMLPVVPIMMLIVAKAAIVEKRWLAPHIVTAGSLIALILYLPVLLCLPMIDSWYLLIVKLCGV